MGVLVKQRRSWIATTIKFYREVLCIAFKYHSIPWCVSNRLVGVADWDRAFLIWSDFVVNAAFIFLLLLFPAELDRSDTVLSRECFLPDSELKSLIRPCGISETTFAEPRGHPLSSPSHALNNWKHTVFYCFLETLQQFRLVPSSTEVSILQFLTHLIHLHCFHCF